VQEGFIRASLLGIIGSSITLWIIKNETGLGFVFYFKENACPVFGCVNE